MTAPYRFDPFKGKGLAIARRHDANEGDAGTSTSKVAFTHLAFTFPLKLISPRAASRDAIARIARQDDRSRSAAAAAAAKPVAALYVVGYGGGLVSGDAVSIDMDVGEGCTMLLLTQGSTKVYKMRRRGLSAAAQSTSQLFRCIVRAHATLVILPDPVTCFSRSRYVQTQQIDVHDAKTSSLVLLDWFTPGRMYLTGRDGKEAKGERWAFSAYTSRNEVRLNGQHVVARDVVTLEQTDEEADDEQRSPIAAKCEPYTCFATLILLGTDCGVVVEHLKATFYAIQQHRPRATDKHPQDVLWSCSALTSPADGLIVRVAGLTTESVRSWLRQHLDPLKMIVGDDLYKQALGI